MSAAPSQVNYQCLFRASSWEDMCMDWSWHIQRRADSAGSLGPWCLHRLKYLIQLLPMGGKPNYCAFYLNPSLPGSWKCYKMNLSVSPLSDDKNLWLYHSRVLLAFKFLPYFHGFVEWSSWTIYMGALGYNLMKIKWLVLVCKRQVLTWILIAERHYLRSLKRWMSKAMSRSIT